MTPRKVEFARKFLKSGMSPPDVAKSVEVSIPTLERLLTDQSGTFVNVSADLVDAQIEQALERLVDFLGVERGSLGQISEENKGILATHSFVVTGYPPFPRLILEKDLPWYSAQVVQGALMRFDRLPDDVPAEAAIERAYAIKMGMKSNVTIPLKVGGIVLGALSFGAFREFRAWPDEHLQRLWTVGEIFANALARKRADQELLAREESLRKTQDELRLLAGMLLQAALTYDQARAAYKAGDYGQALQLDQQALAQTPNDTTMHEFLGLAYFAQGKYEQAAASLYAVLSVRPGWDWTTLSGMYPDVDTYTGQLRALEGYVRSNPASAHARFVLAYQYLAQGHDPQAITQLKEVVKLQPGDTISAQIIAAFQPSGGTTPPPAEPAKPAAPGVEGKLAGTWAASPASGAKIALAVQDGGAFTWSASSPGKPPMNIAG
jgi:tetratricopeptide (TPR) repeat protein